MLEEVEDEFWCEERHRSKSTKFLMYQADNVEATELDLPRTKHPTQDN